jgi:hypothetical protein
MGRSAATDGQPGAGDDVAGTSVQREVDPERRELLLHLLDVTRAEQTLDSIRRDFLQPVRTLFGGKP